MTDLLTFLQEEQIDPALIDGVREYRKNYPVEGSRYANRLIAPEAVYYGNAVWEKAIAAILTGRNLLLAGPKATGKNVLADNLCALFARPAWNVSFHIGMDAYGLIGMDTYDGEKVVFRPGPVYLAAKEGGFAVLDEVNMAKNESLAVLHAALDHRRVIDVPGYDRIDVSPAARFIGTMNYGYAGTRDLNEALSSRFVILSMPPISGEDLTRLLAARFPGMKERVRDQFVRLFLEIMKKCPARTKVVIADACYAGKMRGSKSWQRAVKNEDVMRKLKGPKGTKVKVQVLRRGVDGRYLCGI